MKAFHPVTPDLQTLCRLFYDQPESLGRFDEVDAEAMPERFRRLLAHEHHMTVRVEDYHHSPVDVRVLQRAITPSHYAREILLARQTDGGVVQYGIMRVNLACLDAAVRREIESEGTPLGRILIEHNVLRRVHLFSLWRIEPAARLRELLNLRPGEETYGRTALIYCNHEPAIELLEIVN